MTINLLDQLINSFIDSKNIEDPFPHKFIENIFPLSFYDDLLNNIPDKSLYTPIKDTGSVGADYPDERFIFNFTDKKDSSKLLNQQKLFFDNLTKVLFAKELFQAVTSSFRKTLQLRINTFSDTEKRLFDFPNLKFSYRAALIKDFTKYSLGAHTDNESKFITFLFYIPSTDELKANGTSLYSPITNVEGAKHFTSEQTQQNFKKIKTCPFVPNSVLLFPRTSNSFHGVEEVNINMKERNLLLLNYYFIKI